MCLVSIAAALASLDWCHCQYLSDPPPLRHAVALAAEFQYPANWLADQTLYFRAAQRAEAARSLDPPALKRPRGRQVTEPSAAFGPPGSRCGRVGAWMDLGAVNSCFTISRSCFCICSKPCRQSKQSLQLDRGSVEAGACQHHCTHSLTAASLATAPP